VSETAKLTMDQRYHELGRLTHVAGESWRTEKEALYCRELAQEILAINRQFERRRDRKTFVATPLQSRLNIDWLGRSQLYSRSETAAVALRVDLTFAGETRRGRPHRASYEDYLRTSLYWLTVANVLDENRHRDFGGNWLLADPASEEHAADSYYALTYLHTPFNQREVSRLRSLVRRCTDWELEDYVQLLEETETGLLEKWTAWEQSCMCELDGPPHEGCAVHALQESVLLFSEAIRSHWNQLTDWYLGGATSPLDPAGYPWSDEAPEH
jgi:hypothetical protein